MARPYICRRCGARSPHTYGWAGGLCGGCIGAPDAPDAPAMTYQQQYRRCGRPGCKCADGPGHGPYWYGYWTEDGRTRSRYLGKADPRPPAPLLQNQPPD